MDMTKDFGKNLFSMIVTGATRRLVTPVKIRKDGPVTVVFWQDGTATSVRCGAGEQYDDYVAFCAALAKKLFLSNSAVKRVLKNTPVETIRPVLLDDNKIHISEQAPVTAKSYTFNISSVEVKDLD